MKNIAKSYRNFRPFSEDEAWLLFKIAAICEAVGWTLLISGILIERFLTPGNSIPVEIAGHIHGTLFLIYITGVIVVAPSLGWSVKRTIIGGLFSVPPYGTLMYEQWSLHNIKLDNFKLQSSLVGYRILSDSTFIETLFFKPLMNR
jgi:integral membrane protein